MARHREFNLCRHRPGNECSVGCRVRSSGGFHRGTDLSLMPSSVYLQRIAATLNGRPRPTLDLQTPADRLAAL